MSEDITSLREYQLMKELYPEFYQYVVSPHINKSGKPAKCGGSVRRKCLRCGKEFKSYDGRRYCMEHRVDRKRVGEMGKYHL